VRLTGAKVELDVEWPEVFDPLLFDEESQYLFYYGGRGGAKSWQFARALVLRSLMRKRRILCTREFQSSIADSVYKILEDQIVTLGLEKYFRFTQTNIKAITGSDFIFKGLHHNVREIKSTEGVDICWVEEAQVVSKDSWEVLDPTIRKEGAQIWVSMNTGVVDDPMYQFFVVNTPPGALVRKVGWQDNPYFPATLDKKRRHMGLVDPDAYENVWEGEPLKLSAAQIFHGKYSVETFETPADVQRFYYGADWGFGADPCTMGRCFIRGDELFVDYDCYGYEVDLDDLPALWDTVPGARLWPILADDSRPETIRFMRARGFQVRGAPKSWKDTDLDASAKKEGSIKEGITFLRNFRRIVIHERCKEFAEEAKLYRYKTDPVTEEVLPIIIDKHNHGWDRLRYSLQPLIKAGVDWEALIGDE
jgi:phage terminase large subunit